MRLKNSLCRQMIVALVLTVIFSFQAFAYTEGYFRYEMEDQSIVITEYFGKESVVTVPNTLLGYPVSKIAAGAFIKCKTITTLNLPDTIMEVETGALPANIKVVYDSNTDQSQNSGINDLIQDSKETELKKETEDVSLGTVSTEAKKEPEKEFEIEEVEIDLEQEIENSETASAKTPEESATEDLTEKESTVSSEPVSETDQETETEEQTEKSAETETETESEAMEQEEKHASNTSWLWVVVAAVVLAALYGRKTRKK